MKTTIPYLLHRAQRAYMLLAVYAALALLALLVPVSVRGDAEMCYALFYPKPEIRGLHPKLYGKMNKALSDKTFLAKVEALLIKESVQVTPARSLIEMLTEAASYIDSGPQFEYKSTLQKSVLWNRLASEIMRIGLLEIDQMPAKISTVEIRFPLYMTLISIGYRFESIAFNDQHLSTTESKKVRELLATNSFVKRKYSQSNIVSADSQKVKSLDEIPTVEEHGHNKDRPRSMKIAQMKPLLRDTLLEVYNFMHDIPEFENYAGKLYLDVALMTKRMSEENLTQRTGQYSIDLKSGVLSPEMGLKVLLYRFIRWGIPIHPIFDGFITTAEFQKILQSGSTILDFGILEKVPQHGYASHLIQHDYILTRLTERYGHDAAVAKMTMLLQFFATSDGIGFWSDIFDSFVLGQLNSPIVLNHEITRWLSGFTRDVSQF